MTLTALFLATALLAPAAESAVALPARVRPGEAFLVVVRGARAAPKAIVAGRALDFFLVRGGFAAVAALPVEAPAGQEEVPVEVPSEEGGTLSVPLAFEVVPARYPRERIEVEPGYVEPHPPEVLERLEADRAALAEAFAQPPTPPLFAGPFALPRRARVTGRFGVERVLNGVKSSQHYGLDLAGRVGEPVAAANAGKVVLVRDCWASGKTVVLFHGAGLYTTYLHLSRALVEEGAKVSRGERIGLVGRSGRVSGPHLHFGTKVHDLYVDPESVLRLPLGVERPLTP